MLTHIGAPPHRASLDTSLGADGSLLRVVEVDAQADPRWLAFVTAHPSGSIHHHPRWLQVLTAAYGYRPICLACESPERRVRGILALCHPRGLAAGRGLTSLPRTPVAGPLAVDSQATAALLEAAVSRVQPRARLELRVLSAQLDGLLEGLAGAPWELTYVLALPERIDELRFGNSRNHTRIKWAVSKANKLGVKVRPAKTVDELRAWYGLYLNTMRWHGVPPRPYRFFKVCWDLLRPYGLMRLLVAEQHQAGRSKLLAGSVFLAFNQTVTYAFNGRCRDDLSLRPNDAIQWQAIHDACRDGFRYYDFGETAEHNRGLAEFKSKWGAEPRWLYKYYYPMPQASKPNTELPDWSRRLAGEAFHRLPTRVTAFLGNLIHSYL